VTKRLDFLRAIASGEQPQRPVHRLIGARFTSAEEGKVVLEFDTDERHYANPLGLVQGGILCSVIDSALTAAFATSIEDDEEAVTLEIKVNFLRPLKGGKVTAVGRLVQRGRTVGLSECDLTDD
jgi:uncharacterized protein (TIGR00369 family)